MPAAYRSASEARTQAGHKPALGSWSVWCPAAGSVFRLLAHEEPAPDSTRALLFDNLESGYAAFRRRHRPIAMPRPPSSDQMMRVAGSGTASLLTTRNPVVWCSYNVLLPNAP